MKTTNLKNVIALVALSAVSAACGEFKPKTYSLSQTEDQINLETQSEIKKNIGGGIRSGRNPGTIPGRPRGGTGPTNPNSGRSFGCNWETKLDLSQCELVRVDTSVEIYENTRNCQIDGNTTTFELFVNGLWHDGSDLVQSHFSRKNGAKVVVYNYDRFCEGEKAANQHEDYHYNCPQYENVTCRP